MKHTSLGVLVSCGVKQWRVQLDWAVGTGNGSSERRQAAAAAGGAGHRPSRPCTTVRALRADRTATIVGQQLRGAAELTAAGGRWPPCAQHFPQPDCAPGLLSVVVGRVLIADRGARGSRLRGPSSAEVPAARATESNRSGCAEAETVKTERRGKQRAAKGRPPPWRAQHACRSPEGCSPCPGVS